MTLLVTVDTNQLDRDRIERLEAVLYVPHHLALVSVAGRERGDVDLGLESIPETLVWGEGRWGEAVWSRPIPEVLLLDESRLNEAVLGRDEHVDVFETALAVISNASFPPPGVRDELTIGQRRQLRDAMIFEAHVREGRHVFVTDDAKGFINQGRRSKLEQLGRTHIRTPDELEALAERRELDGLFVGRE